MAEVLQPVLSKARATVLFLEVLQRVLFFPFTSACQARAVVLQHAYSVTRNASVLDFDERKLETVDPLIVDIISARRPKEVGKQPPTTPPRDREQHKITLYDR